MIRVPLRRYQLGKLYGPGMPYQLEEGLREDLVAMPRSSVGIVSVHCWNLGEPDGPYPLVDGSRSPGKIEDWVPKAHRIISERIKPLFDVARDAGIPIYHLGSRTYADRYPGTAAVANDPELQAPPAPPRPAERCVRPHEGQMLRLFGPQWPGSAWETHPEQFDIARDARPVDDEPVLVNGWQLNGLCRRADIDTLFYVGFMAEICLQHVSGAIVEMASKFDYRCVALRDCTTAYEYEDTVEGQWMTNAAIRRIETEYGHSSTSLQLVTAIREGVPAAAAGVSP